MLTRLLSIDLKEDGILVTSIHPGWVKTDMGGEAAPLTPDESSTQVIETMLKMTRDHHGGYYRYDGQKMPW